MPAPDSRGAGARRLYRPWEVLTDAPPSPDGWHRSVKSYRGRYQDPPAVPMQPVQEAGVADRRHGVPGHQAAADHLVRGHLPPDAEQGRDQLDRIGPAARGEAGHRLADEAQADA